MSMVLDNTTAAPRPGPLPRATFLLLLLAGDNAASIQGRTRLEKLAFLVQKRVIEGLKVGVTVDTYRFRSLRYGPYTEEVLDDILTLQLLNLARIEGDDEATQVFRITQEGQTAVDRLLTEGRVSRVLVEEVDRIKRFFGRLRLEQLIERVYKDYPEYTDKSEIKDRFIY